MIMDEVRVAPVAAGSHWNRDAELMSTGELAATLGVSRRQIDYWQRNGVFGEVIHTGSGISLGWRPEALPVYRAVAAVSVAFTYGSARKPTGVDCQLLRRVADNYSDGRLDLGGGVALTWKVEK